MILAAFKYGYPNAKTRALRGKLLSSEDRQYLTEARDIKTFLSYLATTNYGPYIPDRFVSLGHPLSGLERSLALALMKDYAKCIKALTGKKEKDVILALYSRFEAQNLKILLKTIHAKIDRQRVLHLLYPLGNLTKIDWKGLWQAKSIKEVASLLVPYPFGNAITRALPSYEAQAGLFPLEMAVDIASFRNIEEALFRLKNRQDKKAAFKIVGLFVDILNINWIIRLKRHYRLTPEEVVNYSLPGGFMSLSQVHNLARAQNLQLFLKGFPRWFGQNFAGVTRWNEIPPLLEKLLRTELSRVFLWPPFNIGPEIAYLLEKEQELNYVISLMGEKAQQRRRPNSLAGKNRSRPETIHV